MYRIVKKLVTSVITFALLLAATGFVNAAELTDCSGRHDEMLIKECYKNELILGYNDNTFKPDRLISRAEFVTILNRAFKFTKTTDISFSDVKPDAWYKAEIAKAVAAGYISADKSGNFKPEATVSKLDASGMLAAITKSGTASDLAQADKPLTRAEALSLIYKAFKEKAGVTKADTTVYGVLIDKHCFDLKDPVNDMKMCLMMEMCAASGYGAAVLQKDNTYKFYKFDEAGQMLAMDILMKTTKTKNITIEVTGSMDGELLKVASMMEK